MKLTTTPMMSFVPLRMLAVPTIPKGPTPRSLQDIMIARQIIAHARAIRILLMSSLAMIEAPTTAPTIEEPIIRISVSESISTFWMNTKAVVHL